MLATLAQFFAQGGAFMWVILTILAAAVAVAVERLIFYHVVCRGRPRELVSGIARAFNQDESERALALAASGRSPLHAILSAAVQRFEQGLPIAAVRQGVEEAAIREMPRFGRRLGYLALFANIATLTGLLGTIFGLQKSFASLGAAEAAQKATMLAAGISQALNTTAFGLIVAIPCMVAYAVLTQRQAARIEDVDGAAVEMLNYLEARRAAEDAQPARPTGCDPATPRAGHDARAPQRPRAAEHAAASRPGAGAAIEAKLQPQASRG